MAADGYTAVPSTWKASGQGMVEASNTLATAVDTLCYALADAGDCWGNDEIGRAFFNGDDKTAGFVKVRDAVLDDLADMVNVVRATGGKLKISGHNYSVAEQASTIGSALPEGADQGALAAVNRYWLPHVRQTLVESDPPPGGFEWLFALLETLVGGCEWPDGDQAKLASMRDAFHTAARSVNGVANDISGHTVAVTTNNDGDAAHKFASFAAALQGGGDEGGLRWLAAACQALGDATDFLHKQKDAARLQFKLSVVFLAAVWAIALAVSWITGGGSVGAATAATEAEGTALRLFLQNIAKSVIVRGAAMGAVFSGGLDAVGQYARIHEGVQDGFSVTELAKAGGEGALAGGVMGGAGAWVARGGNRFTTALASYMESGRFGGVVKFGFNGLNGTVGNLGGQLVFEHHFDIGKAAEFGFGMAGIETAKDIGRYGANRFGGSLKNLTRYSGGDDGGGPPPPHGNDDGGGPPPPRGNDDDGGGPPPPGTDPVSQGDNGSTGRPGGGKDDDGGGPPPPGGAPAATPVGGHETQLAGSEPPRDTGPGPGHGTDHVPGSSEPAVRSAPAARPEGEPAPVGMSTPGDRPAVPEAVRPGVTDVPRGRTEPVAGRTESGGTTRPTDRPVTPAADRSTPRTTEAPPVTGRTTEPAAHGTPPRAEPGLAGETRGPAPAGERPPASGHPATPPVTERPDGTVRPADPAPSHAEGTGPASARPEGGTPGRAHGEAEPAPIVAALDPHGTNGVRPEGPSRIERILSGAADPAPHSAPHGAPHDPPATSPEPRIDVPPPPSRPPQHVVDRGFLEDMLHRAGHSDLSPAPEVPPHVLRDLRVRPEYANDLPPATADPVRLAGDLRDTLHSRTVEGGDILARLHELNRDGAMAQKVNEAYHQATGRDLWSDIERARSEGRLDFDPRPYLDHLLPDTRTAWRLIQEAGYTRMGDPQFARDLNNAIAIGDGPRVSELLSRAGRSPGEIWRLQDNYRGHYGADPIDHIRDRFGGSEGDYLAHLLGEPHLETHVLSIAEAQDLYHRLSGATFTTLEGGEARIPFGHPEDGCYDRAHRMTKQLSEWGYSSRKAYAVRSHHTDALRIQAETARGAGWQNPRDVVWSYHVAPVVNVRHPDGQVVEVVMDPSLRRGPLGMDEWVGLMGVSRNDYLRFDTVGPLPPEVGKIVADMVSLKVGSKTALVYTAPRETYMPSITHPTFRAADMHSQSSQATIEGFARASEARELGNHIWSDSYWQGPAKMDVVVSQTVHKVLTDPAFRMLLADARAGRPWPPDVAAAGGMQDMAVRLQIAKRAYDTLRSMAGPPAAPAPR